MKKMTRRPRHSCGFRVITGLLLTIAEHMATELMAIQNIIAESGPYSIAVLPGGLDYGLCFNGELIERIPGISVSANLDLRDRDVRLLLESAAAREVVLNRREPARRFRNYSVDTAVNMFLRVNFNPGTRIASALMEVCRELNIPASQSTTAAQLYDEIYCRIIKNDVGPYKLP